MNFYDDIDVYGDAPAIITERSEIVSYAELVRLADAVGAQLTRKSVVIIQCDNSVASIAGYLGCLRTRAVPLLVGRVASERQLHELTAAYQPEFFWLPTEYAGNAMPGHEVHRLDGYSLMASDRERASAVHEE